MESALTKQEATKGFIARFWDNLLKAGKDKITPLYLKTRLELLEGYWKKFEDGHYALLDFPDIGKTLYKLEDHYTATENLYVEMKIRINEALSEKTAKGIVASTPSMDSTTLKTLQLPKISLPTFSGDRLAWERFRELFTSLVHDVDEIPPIQKLQYLQTSLSGDAEACIANIEMTADGYQAAWDALVDRYDNRRGLLAAHMRALWSCPAVGKNASADINNLVNVINQATRSFRSLGRPVEHWDDWIVFIAVEKLDPGSRMLWEAELPSDASFPPLTQLLEFLRTRARSVESADLSSVSAKTTTPASAARPGRKTQVATLVAGTTHVGPANRCHLCKGPHSFNFCSRFKAMTPAQRREQTKRRKACFNCLKPGHGVTECPCVKRCQVCQEPHHTLLHPPRPSADSSETPGTSTFPGENAGGPSVLTVTSHATALRAPPELSSITATARVTLRGPDGKTAIVRALLDSGAEVNFISERVVQLLSLQRQPIKMPLTGIRGAYAGTASSWVSVSLSAPSGGDWTREVPCALVLRKLTALLPGTDVTNKDWPHLDGLSLADPSFRIPAPVDAVFNADVVARTLRDGSIEGPPGCPSAQLTVFGWVIMGSIGKPFHPAFSPRETMVHQVSSPHNLDRDLQRFWELEEVSHKPVPTPEDALCEEMFETCHSREPSGRYVVRLPRRNAPNIPLGESRPSAVKLLLAQERRLERDAALHQKYVAFLEEYRTLGHMRRVESRDDSSNCANYLPHHAVVKTGDAEGKLRVVFNASFRTTSGFSLNDALMAGPRLQSDLWVVISRWRLFRYAFTADIVKMFRQIQLHPDDWDWQRIVWRDQPHQEIADYHLTTVTYGTTSAPFLALRTLLQLAKDEGSRFPLGAEVIERHSYVDDLLAGADNLEDALEVRRQLVGILEAGGFPLSKWAANNPELCPDGDSNPRMFQEPEGLPTLGLLWYPETDSFQLRVTSALRSLATTTKRTVLSDVARFFDPLGWAAPVLIFGKIFIQRLWMAGLGWDDPLSLELQASWTKFASSLPNLDTVRVRRWVEYSTTESVELHGFCDASSHAYAAAVYLRCTGSGGKGRSRLLVARTKVAPVKPTSIPRLELCGALLLARLLNAVATGLRLEAAQVYAWTDAEVVLAWIASHPSRWKPFVANRVAALQDLVAPSRWRYVPTEDNPADAATRGIAAEDLASNGLWWTGPPWLSLCSRQWPAPKSHCQDDEVGTSELRPATVLLTSTRTENEILSRFSSMSRLLRTSALCVRFAFNCRNRQNPRTGFITAVELESCRQNWVLLAQRADFSEEIRALTENRSVSRRSTLLSLRPILGKDGLLRVGGRLQHALLPYAEKHPVILAKGNHLSLLLVREAHACSLRGGPQLTRSLLLRRYWIIHAGSLVRSVVHKCVRCARFRLGTVSQQMGQLPADRVRPARPFETSGVDYAGPIPMRTTKGRGHKSYKGYICLFVCLVTKAVHLEAASDLTATAFLDAFRRFISRRGPCRRLISDNGTNFRGADAQLRAMFRAASAFSQEVGSRLANDGTEWSFIPPGAPHFGGLWEAGVKAVKYHLRRVLGDHKLTFEEMSTLLCQVEACLNSRPLSPLNNNSDDLAALTPGHLLIGEPLVAVPEPPRLDIPATQPLSRWAQVSRMRDHFWRRWSAEYLHHLQTLTKWRRKTENISVGTLVLLKDENLPPTKWALALVTQLHAGSDGLVRVVTVKTAGGTLKRPIAKVCVLPISPSQQLADSNR